MLRFVVDFLNLKKKFLNDICEVYDKLKELIMFKVKKMEIILLVIIFFFF